MLAKDNCLFFVGFFTVALSQIKKKMYTSITDQLLISDSISLSIWGNICCSLKKEKNMLEILILHLKKKNAFYLQFYD